MRDYLKFPFRDNGLYQIISGLDRAIKYFSNNIDNGYDVGCFLDDTQSIYGLGFIAFQNYINSSIKDYNKNSIGKHEFYQSGQPISGFDKSSIELIVTLANYSKHLDDDSEFHENTKNVLKHFKLNTEKDGDVDNSAIFRGLDLLDEKWDLFKIMKIVNDWRENLWGIEGNN